MQHGKSETSDREFKELVHKFKRSFELQDAIVDSAHGKITTRNIHFLVDTYGLFKGAKDLWSRFSNRQNHWAINFIAVRSLEMIRTGYEIYSSLHYDNLIREYEISGLCRDCDNNIEKIKKKIENFDGILRCKFSVTYAAAPDDNGRVRKKIEKNIFDGHIEDSYGKSFIRSLVQYENFIKYLRQAHFTKGTLHKGYFQLTLDHNKVRPSEKEVDSLLIIEAMDILYGGDIHEVVMISNDSDFNPLGDRFWGSGTLYSQVRLGGILSGERYSRIRYEAEAEILEQFSKKQIMQDMIREFEIHDGRALSSDEVDKIESYINGNV